MTTFGEQLNQYIRQIDCTFTELAEKTGLSASSVSRYCSGMRVPNHKSDVAARLAAGLAQLAVEKKVALSENEIYEGLGATLSHGAYQDFPEHFGMLISTLQLSLAELSKNINYDASYLSRIRKGQRMPSNVDKFVEETCHYIVRKYADDDSLNKMAELLNCEKAELEDRNTYYTTLVKWFGAELSEPAVEMDHFLRKMDEFDLNEYIRSIHFDELKVPTVPFQLPTLKNYYGVEQMKQGELDFFKTTVLSKNMGPVFMCSDMPMEDMAEDVEFGKKWMFAIAMSIKKGLHLNIIHNIDRPFQEMMLGLESWIPIYMTGQVSPYHLKNVTTNVYRHLNYVSGVAALSGECVTGHHDEGKYYLTNNKEEVAYYRKKSERLLAKAHPLMEIYRDSEEKGFGIFLQTSSKEEGSRRNILSSLPLYTIEEDLLRRILNRAGLTEKERTKVLSFAKEQRKCMEEILAHDWVEDEIPEISEEEFKKSPMLLAVSGVFMEIEIPYTYEEYREHLNTSMEFSKKHENYRLTISHSQTFRNIQIQILEDKWVLISKSKTPVVHFLIRHPKMVNALQNFIPPVME